MNAARCCSPSDPSPSPLLSKTWLSPGCPATSTPHLSGMSSSSPRKATDPINKHNSFLILQICVAAMKNGAWRQRSEDSCAASQLSPHTDPVAAPAAPKARPCTGVQARFRLKQFSAGSWQGHAPTATPPQKGVCGVVFRPIPFLCMWMSHGAAQPRHER